MKNSILLILLVLVATTVAAQDAIAPYVGSTHTYQVENHPGSSYQWAVLDDFNPVTSTDPSRYSFSGDIDQHAISIEWEATGVYYLLVVEFDVTGCSNKKAVRIEVGEIPNEAPVAVNDSYSEIEDQQISGDVLDNDSDADGDPLTVTNVTLLDGPEGVLDWNPDGSFIYTPPSEFQGTVVYEYEVCDDYEPPYCATATITFDYSGNARPVAVDDEFTTNENEPVSGNLLANDSDPDGNYFLATRQTKSTTNGQVFIDVDGTFTYTPNPGFFGTDEFTYEMRDDGNPRKYDTGMVTITVLEVFEFNRVAVNDIALVFEDMTLTGNVADNDINFDEAGVTYSIPTGSNAVNGNASIDPSGGYTYTPAAGYLGIDNFYYEACADQEPVGCDDANVTVRVLPKQITSIHLIANDDEAETAVNIPVSGNVLLNDFSPVDDELAVNATPVQGVAHGQLILNSDGSYQYTPEEGYVGEDYFVYQVCGMVTGDCQNARATILVKSETEPSVFAVDDVYQIFSNEQATGNLLANDIVPSRMSLSANTTLVKQPTLGTVSINSNGNFTYTPTSSNYPFVDQFVYEACNAEGACTRAKVFVVVAEQPEEFADLSILKTGPSEASPGEDITYTITISNSGSLVAENVLLDDFLPAYILNPRYRINGVDPAANWPNQLNLGNLADEESVEVEITGVIADGAPDIMENYASVQSDQFDPDLSNNYSSARTNTNRAPVIIVEGGLLHTIGCCKDDGLQLDASQSIGVGELTYLWEPATGLDNPNSSTPIFSGVVTTEYTLTVTAENGFSSQEQVVVEVAPCPEVVMVDQVFVESSNETVMLDASESIGRGLTFAWWADGNEVFVSGETTANPVVSGLGTYYLQITDEFGCTDLDSISVGLMVQMQAMDDSVSVDINNSVDINVLANDIPKEEINPSTLEIIFPPENGIAVVTADSIITYTPNQYYAGSDDFIYTICDFANNCDNANVLVMVNDEPLFIPNAFSPNGDGINDLFEIKGIAKYDEVKLKVFNRWGNQVYEANNYGAGAGRNGFWDGVANKGGNGDVPTGTYYYILDLGPGNEKLSGYVYIDR